MKPCIRRAFARFGAGVMLLVTGVIMALGDNYPGRGGELPMLSTPARHLVSAFDSLAGRMATFFPDLYYHLALGTLGAGICPELDKASDAKGFLVQPPGAAVPHFRPSMQPGSSFNWGRVKPTFTVTGNHFYLPAKPLPLAPPSGRSQPGP